jgi:hypothetical protein
MPVIPDVIHSLDTIKKIHKDKNDDYALDSNPYFNFDVQQYVMELFNDPRDKVFASLIGLKLARIANLLNQSGQPKNESIDDSFIDFATYILLHKADRKRRNDKRQPLSTTAIKEANNA